jgi:hypothetical protein
MSPRDLRKQCNRENRLDKLKDLILECSMDIDDLEKKRNDLLQKAKDIFNEIIEVE